jgi:hypothetical protein
MRIAINPITVTTDNGDVVCSEAEVSVAVSNSVAIRIVPVDDEGIEYPLAATGVVGATDQPDIAEFFDAVGTAVSVLVSGRGL